MQTSPAIGKQTCKLTACLPKRLEPKYAPHDLKTSGLFKRVEPLAQKLTGRLPACPWIPILRDGVFRKLKAYPPKIQVEQIRVEGDLQQLRFGGEHEVWFPISTKINDELWSEYLSVFWRDAVNGHYYLSHGTSIKKGDVCVDCGCCEGFFVFQALEEGAARVIAIEPNPAMVVCLEKTFAKEIKDGRVIIHPTALSSFQGQTSFAFDAAFPAFGQMGGEGIGASTVAVETLAVAAEKLGLDRIDFIKMDIEGAEISALDGAMTILKKYHPKLAITTYHRTFDYRALQAMAWAAGYRQIKAAGLTKWLDGIYRPIMLHAI